MNSVNRVRIGMSTDIETLQEIRDVEEQVEVIREQIAGVDGIDGAPGQPGSPGEPGEPGTYVEAYTAIVQSYNAALAQAVVDVPHYGSITALAFEPNGMVPGDMVPVIKSGNVWMVVGRARPQWLQAPTTEYPPLLVGEGWPIPVAVAGGSTRLGGSGSATRTFFQWTRDLWNPLGLPLGGTMYTSASSVIRQYDDTTGAVFQTTAADIGSVLWHQSYPEFVVVGNSDPDTYHKTKGSIYVVSQESVLTLPYSSSSETPPFFLEDSVIYPTSSTGSSPSFYTTQYLVRCYFDGSSEVLSTITSSYFQGNASLGGWGQGNGFAIYRVARGKTTDVIRRIDSGGTVASISLNGFNGGVSVTSGGVGVALTLINGGVVRYLDFETGTLMEIPNVLPYGMEFNSARGELVDSGDGVSFYIAGYVPAHVAFPEMFTETNARVPTIIRWNSENLSTTVVWQDPYYAHNTTTATTGINSNNRNHGIGYLRQIHTQENTFAWMLERGSATNYVGDVPSENFAPAGGYYFQASL